VIYPEAVLTFRTVEPASILTERSAHAFQAVRQEDYEQRALEPRRQPARRTWGPAPPYWGPYWYPGWWYGPSFVYYSGPRYRGRGRWR
jgi:hypothetical protein